MTKPNSKNVWLDVDPGHDDATAIMLAIQCENIHLLGISTTHGNASAEHTASNAARCLVGFGAPEHVLVHPGATKPLLRPAKHDPEIHGEDGLGGVVGLPDAQSPEVLARFARDDRTGKVRNAVEGMKASIGAVWDDGKGEKVVLVSSGPQTNLALFLSVYPELIDAIEEIVFMGGGVGMGNRSAVAEYNILCDPHASQIVLDIPVPKTMIPINVTHTAILTPQLHEQLLNPHTSSISAQANHPTSILSLPPPLTPLRATLSSLVTFFAVAYESTFGFTNGPPLHDALTIAYITRPELFKRKRYRVDVELEGRQTIGETVVDVWNYQGCDETTWGVGGKNCSIAESLDVEGFFELFLACVEKCDSVSPLNRE